MSVDSLKTRGRSRRELRDVSDAGMLAKSASSDSQIMASAIVV